MAETFDAFVADFVIEAQERCDRIEELLLSAMEEGCHDRDALLDDARRQLHTLKGNAGMVGLRDLQSAAHALEDEVGGTDPAAPAFRGLLHKLDDFRALLNASIGRGAESPARPGMQPLRTVRVPFSALDELVDLLAEMVVFRNRLDDAIARGRGDGAGDSWRGISEAHDALGKTLSFLQDRIMAVRMVPLRTLFGQLRRIVHDESAAAGKDARFVATGGDTPMDKALLEAASESLGHLVRNAVTHGIETPETRAARGKRREGVVQLSATTHADEVWIEVRDDGAGIDPQVIAQVAREKGFTHEEGLRLLFQSGFSTRADSDVSAGRGMGLSAALQAVRRVGGDVDAQSAVGHGAQFRLRLPLTLSITRALIVRADRDEYALPLSAIVESLRIDEGTLHVVNDAAVFNWRGSVVPVLDLGLVMDSATALRRSGYVVVIEGEGKRRGLLVDELIGMREIVVKGLGDIGAVPTGISGATILGDGRVLLILDPRALAGLSPLLPAINPSGVAA